MLTKVIKRFSHNLKNFDNLEELNKFLTNNKFSNTLVYFRANWNPQCQETDKDIQKFAAKFPGYQVIRVDSDAAPKIARHYSVRAEP